jgi:hypothetical protein
VFGGIGICGKLVDVTAMILASGEQAIAPKSRIDRFLVVSFLSATSVNRAVMHQKSELSNMTKWLLFLAVGLTAATGCLQQHARKGLQ